MLSLVWYVLKEEEFTSLSCSPCDRAGCSTLPRSNAEQPCQALCSDSLTSSSRTESATQQLHFSPLQAVSTVINVLELGFFFFLFFSLFSELLLILSQGIYKSSLNGLFLKHRGLPDKITQTKEHRPSICPNTQSEFHHRPLRDLDLALFLQIWKTLVKLQNMPGALLSSYRKNVGNINFSSACEPGHETCPMNHL